MNGYDVIIVGGSFAGLAVAQALKGYHVLIIDHHPIGEHQTSACATPLTTARAVGAEASILEVHPALVLHTAGQAFRFDLKAPFASFDYRTFCQAMLAHAEAEVVIARATHYHDGIVTTGRGNFSGRYVVDATGWAAALSGAFQTRRAADAVAYGLETELPVRPNLGPGLHFYFNRRYVKRGYAWAFPCGQTTRFGIGNFYNSQGLRASLERFMSDFGLAVGPTHGGVLSFGFHEPVTSDLFVVGDAAGQCLPLTGEGIRTAIYHGLHCGRAIRGILQGEFSSDEARAFYQDLVLCHERTYHRLWLAQRGVALLPASWLAAIARAVIRLEFGERLMDRYLRNTGWFLGYFPLPKQPGLVNNSYSN